jgi:NAD(P)H-dependent FMN reductase
VNHAVEDVIQYLDVETQRKSKILVFAGSIRTGSYNEKLAAIAARELQSAGMDVTLAHLRDYTMPLYDGDTEAAGGLPDGARRFKELVRAHDVLVLASPEYNGSMPALVKNTIDWISGRHPASGRWRYCAAKQKSHVALWLLYQGNASKGCKRLAAMGFRMKKERVIADYDLTATRMTDRMRQQLIEANNFLTRLAASNAVLPVS